MLRSSTSRLILVAGTILALALIIHFLNLGPILWRFLTWTGTLGFWGPVVFVLSYMVGTVFLVPGTIFTLAAGMLFGLGPGLVLAMTGSLLGATMAMLVGRKVVRKWVESLARKQPAFAAMDRAVAASGFKIVMLTRVSPLFPFVLLNYFFSATSVRLRDYILASAIGMLPGSLLYVSFGTALRHAAQPREGVPTHVMPRWAFVLGLLVTLVVTIYLARLARKALKTQLAQVQAMPPPHPDATMDNRRISAPVLEPNPRCQVGRERLVVMTRYPEPGKVKTRLIPALGPDGAAQLQKAMTLHTLGWAVDLLQSRTVDVEVRFDGANPASMRTLFGHRWWYVDQGPGDLGLRMNSAVRDGLNEPGSAVVLIGTDCPGLTPSLLEEAFEALRSNDLVLGPACDGGYVLLGLRRRADELFLQIPWSTDQVLARTLEKASALGLTVHLLKTLPDVDRPEDLGVWEEASQRFKPPQVGCPLSVIVPTLNEEQALPTTLARILQSPGVEAIVSDGGSCDATESVATSCGARFLKGPPGRAIQMNAGARAARGQVLLFCHADTLLPEGFEKLVHQILARPGVVAGAFGLRLDGPGLGLRLIETAANWRSRVFQMPYGDQAIFTGAGAFRRIGGYPAVPILEDCLLVGRLRRLGRMVISPDPALSSARRWGKHGLWRTTLRHQAILAGYHLGVDPSRLASWR